MKKIKTLLVVFLASIAPLMAQVRQGRATTDSANDTPAVDLFTSSQTFSFNVTTGSDSSLLIDWGDGTEKEKIDVQKEHVTPLSHKFATPQPQHEVKIYGVGIKALESPVFTPAKLTFLSVENCPDLEVLTLPYGNDLVSVDFASNNALRVVDLSGSKLRRITLPSDPKALKVLKLIENELRTLSTEGAINLEELKVSSNRLSELDLTHCPKIKKLDVKLNKFKRIKGLLSLTKLEELDLSRNYFLMSEIPPKGQMTTYVYNQHWCEIPADLVKARTIDLSKEYKLRGIADKEEVTTFEWYIHTADNGKQLIPEGQYSNKEGVFTFVPDLFKGQKELSLFVVMKNPSFPDINKKIGGLRSSDVKIINDKPSTVDPTTFNDLYEGLYENAFAGCTHLRKIVLPKNTKELREKAFAGCPALEKVGLQSDCDLVSTAFEDKEGLKVYVATAEIKAKFDGILNFKKAQVVVEDLTSSPMARANEQAVSVTPDGDGILIAPLATEAMSVAVYNSNGTCLHEGVTRANAPLHIRLERGQAYVVCIGEKTYKVLF